MLDTQEKIHQIALSLVKGVGAMLWKNLVTQAGSAQAVFQNPEKSLIKVPGSSRRIAYEILQQDTLQAAEKLFLEHQQKNIQIISIWEDAYPERLKHTAQSPPLLYFRGNVAMNSPRIIGIVGTRNASAYGRRVVEKLVSGLSAYHVLIVSGLAYGIDIEAHSQALKHGLPTVGVLAGSLDAIYPAAHTSIATAMIKQGGLVSENPLQTDLEGYHFPARNRIIAGMADAVIIVEANQKSGAIITANYANAYHREVFAVPGSIYETYSTGCNKLIKTHQAHLITDVADIAYIMNWSLGKQAVLPKKYNNQVIAQLTLAEQGIIQVLQDAQTAIHIDQLSHQTKIPVTQLAAMLLQLELKDMVQCLPGSKFKAL